MAGGPPPGPSGGPGPMGGPGMGGPPGMANMPRINGVELDPLIGLTDTRKPLRSKILAVPAFRERYLKNIRTIAEKSLTWQALEPVISQYRQLIDKEVEADTRKLDSYDAFKKMTGTESITGERGQLSLKAFIEQRQKYLLQHAEVKKVVVK